MKTVTSAVLAALAMTGAAMADDLSSAEFVEKAAAGGAAEVQMGRLGAQKATNVDVKAFAEKMVADHTKANAELARVAKSKGLAVPAQADAMHKGMMEKFEHQKADADFNHDFMQQMVRDHEKTVELFKSAAAAEDLDPDLRALAKKTLPTLETHLEQAKTLEAKVDD